ncbi:NAD(P)H-binding protein [Marinifilum flexuosum]|uniref:Nucleoside-diphosphate-sugar epimerase n=1 Tax=Marinifilum flexuosum TaxID=1117708 RepID=A0A419XAM5_9BACT|nr:NAD(P)H-binding protein [Marinifilum flexuosum]RKE04801.1 nucleoside-diphosphate-sugar epimerase [Marinifilum flexuosum]
MTDKLNLPRISVLGCGWLGLALAKHLSSKGYDVKGSVMQEENLEELHQFGIKGYQIAFNPDLQVCSDDHFFETDIIVSCIPPKRRDDIESYYPKQIDSLKQEAQKHGVKKVLFISSTSVYPNTLGKVSEELQLSPEKASGKALVKAEKLLTQSDDFETTILRFGGLIGYDRHPGRFLSHRKELRNGSVPVNLIHQDDCVKIISEIIKQNVWGEVFNACCPEHPTRKDFYQKAARAANLPEPEFLEEEQMAYKWVDSSKLIKRLNYKFIYTSPLDTI